MDLFQNQFQTFFPELFFIIAITFILLFSVGFNPSPKFQFPILTSIAAWLSIQTLFITFLLLGNGRFSSGSGMVIFNGTAIVDDFSWCAKCLLVLSALSSILISFDYLFRQKINSFEYIVLVLFSTLGMLFIVSSYDLISMYLAIELQSLSFYVIAAFQRNDEFSVEAGIKYFILGALSSGLLLFGESIIYGFTGITNFEELAKLFTLFYDSSSFNSIFIGLLFIFVAFLFKIGAVPFHMWTPDVYEGSPTSVTAFFAITPKVAIFTLLLRLCFYTFYDFISSWQDIILVCSFLSMFVGTLGALYQKKLKRLFAYSSIAHVGYLLIAVATGTIEAVESVLFYIVIYIVMVINVFGIILSLSKQHSSIPFDSHSIHSSIISPHIFKLRSSSSHPSFSASECSTQSVSKLPFPSESLLLHSSLPITSPYQHSNSIFSFSSGSQLFYTPAKYITDLSSLSKTNPILASTFALILFSNAGIPPLAGFYGKFNVFLAAIEGSMFFLAIVAILCSSMGAFYSIRLIKILYFHQIDNRVWHRFQSINKQSAFVLSCTFFFTLFFFLYPSFLFISTHSAALSLCLYN